MRILGKESGRGGLVGWGICKCGVGLGDTYCNKMLVLLDCVGYGNGWGFVIGCGIMCVKYWLWR